MYKELLKYYLLTYYDQFDTADEKKAQENRVKPLIKKLIDKTDIYKDLPFDLLSIEEQCKILNHILEKSPERQIVANMKKTDVDRDYYNFILHDEKAEKFMQQISEGLSGFEPYNIAECMVDNRNLIRELEIPTEEVITELNRRNEILIRLFVDEINKFKILGLEFECISYIRDYIDYVSDGLLQLLNYRVITNSSIDSSKILMNLIEELDSLTVKIVIQLNMKREEQKKLGGLTAEKITRYFSLYRTHYSRYYQILDIYEVLKSEVDKQPALFSSVEHKYRVEKILVSEEEVSKLKEKITEGLHTYDYDSKLEITRKFIEFMNIYGGRHCFSNGPQDLKVYYREIFMSEIKYRNKQAATIVKEYLDKVESSSRIEPFDKQSQYMFVREKISRGYMREKGLLDIYFLKADFERVLYNLLLKLYLFYDFGNILEFIYEVNYFAFNRIIKDVKN
ncbi:hypothetical protein [Clostridium butyricum]|uniref:hypothetical protein n=1 Tax=Clostridium butyricum TaxID=1492 RepID=UPI00325B6F4D